MITLYIFLLAVLLLFYILFEGAFSFYVFAFALALAIVLNIFLSICKRSVKVSFVQALLTADRKRDIPIALKVENRSRIPVPNACIRISYTAQLDGHTERFDINTPIFPKNTQFLTFYITAEHYGIVNIRLSQVKLIDIFKIFKRKTKPAANGSQSECTLTVLPDYEELDNPLMNYAELGIESNTYSKTKSGDDPSEIFDVHEYKEGDKINRIHWKLTAKQQQPMVKEFSLPVANSILLCVNMFVDDSRGAESLADFDSVLEALSAVSVYLTENNCAHTVTWLDGRTNQLQSYTVSDIEDYSVMIKSLLSCTAGDENNGLIKNLCNDFQENKKTGHLIYFTAGAVENSAESLDVSDTALRYTILSAGNAVTAETEIEKVNILPLTSGNIKESLESICF